MIFLCAFRFILFVIHHDTDSMFNIDNNVLRKRNHHYLSNRIASVFSFYDKVILLIAELIRCLYRVSEQSVPKKKLL